MSKFSSIQVGFCGDHAGVTLKLTEPVITTSSKPKDHFHRETFQVVRTTQTFNQATLAVAIEDALKSRDYATHDKLLEAKDRLERFVAQHGTTNPNEEADWEHYHAYGERVPQIA